MVKGNIVKIDIDGISIEGEITHRSGGDICVKITQPFVGLDTGRHIPYFSRPGNSYLGEYGDETAEQLLLSLFRLSNYTDANIEKMHEKYQAVKAQIEELSIVDMTREKFLKKRADLRQQVKDGLLSNNEYGNKLKVIRKKMSEFSYMIHKLNDDFIKENYPMTVSYGDSKQLIPIIEGKISLRSNS